MLKSAFYEKGKFDCLDGAAKEHWDKCSEVKVCITARDAVFLRKLITKIASDEDCFMVKMSKRPRDEMFIARCFFTTREKAGLIWAKYKKHPLLVLNLQDDSLASTFEVDAESWLNRRHEEL